MSNQPELPTEYPPGSILTYVQGRNTIERFEQVLHEHDIRIESGSELGLIGLWIMELEDFRTGRTHYDESEDTRARLRQALGLHDMASKIIEAHEQHRLNVCVPHLRLLNTSSVPQNVRAFSDQGSNKLFELRLVLSCFRFAENVRLDDPDQSAGDNPDVMFHYATREWALAAKVIEGQSPLTLYERLADGIDQIERSEAETGVVVVNMKNVIDHNETWPLNRAWSSHERVVSIMDRVVDERNVALVAENGPENIRRLFDGKKAVRALLAFTQTACCIRTSTGLVPVSLGRLGLMRLGTIVSQDFGVIRKLNEALA